MSVTIDIAAPQSILIRNQVRTCTASTPVKRVKSFSITAGFMSVFVLALFKRSRTIGPVARSLERRSLFFHFIILSSSY